MAAAVTPKPFRSLLYSHHRPNPTSVFNPLLHHHQRMTYDARRKTSLLSVCFLLEEQKHCEPQIVNREEEGSEDVGNPKIDPRILIPAHVAEKLARKRSERFTYLVAAVMSSFGITSMPVMTVYYRFSWHMEGDGEAPLSEMFGTFALSVGAAVGMEFWARWAHRALWHASLWHMHESHHRPREGPFELNDVLAITNVVPAIALLSYGFFKGLYPVYVLVLDLALPCLEWLTCSSTTVLCTRDSRWDRLPMFPTSGRLPRLTRLVNFAPHYDK